MFKIIFFLTALLITQLYSEEPVCDFLKNLYQEYPEYLTIRNSDYQLFCNQYELEDSLDVNQNNFYNICFLHDLFTGSTAKNYVSGGLLEIPYFWHWINPNPRHEIIFLDDSTKLKATKPPSEYSNYQSYADIDRTPLLFLGDLIADRPKYFHPQCGAFFTFGWCSEREMAFNSVLQIWDYKSKIKQSGIHTWSEVLVDFRSKNNKNIIIVFKIDNTFNIISPSHLNNDFSIKEWQNDIGAGETIKWYNKKAHSDSEIAAIMNLMINTRAASRIRSQIDSSITSLRSYNF